MVEATATPEDAFTWQALLSQGLAQGVPIIITPTPTFTESSSVDISVHVGGVDIEVHIECPF